MLQSLSEQNCYLRLRLIYSAAKAGGFGLLFFGYRAGIFSLRFLSQSPLEQSQAPAHNNNIFVFFQSFCILHFLPQKHRLKKTQARRNSSCLRLFMKFQERTYWLILIVYIFPLPISTFFERSSSAESVVSSIFTLYAFL